MLLAPGLRRNRPPSPAVLFKKRLIDHDRQSEHPPVDPAGGYVSNSYRQATQRRCLVDKDSDLSQAKPTERRGGELAM